MRRASATGGVHAEYNVEGLLKTAYYVMLLSHIVLAMVVPVVAIMLIRFGLKGQIDQHRRLARFALPVWLYVSGTGVLIYLALYQFNPAL